MTGSADRPAAVRRRAVHLTLRAARPPRVVPGCLVVGTEEFYDALAPEYDLLFGDWWAAARWQGDVIAGVLSSQGVRPPARVLDCTCGIGTQALPLAALGYRVTATDISLSAIERLRVEAAARGLDMAVNRADVREVRAAVTGSFDAVLACDNSLPHLLSDADLEQALRSIMACLGEGGVLVASVRDYDALRRTRPAGVPITLHGDRGARHGAGQSWRWSEDGDAVDITLFTFREQADPCWQASAFETRYRALGRKELSAALRRVRFRSVRWLEPKVSGYYQPIVMARPDEGRRGAGPPP